ncbi:MAG: polysaccharide deacetylase family protein [Defluviitaleaceae bacterium]|nr:polysaccharide deacetylase family protein [Defluviitaleaceae bacterium]
MKRVALTFDDGPDGEFTPRILNTLAAHNARASFFVLGKKIAGQEEILRRAHAEGSEIISHSWSHCKDPKLGELDPGEIKKELLDTEAAIRAVIDAPATSPKLFRPPYGAVTDRLRDVSREVGCALVNWSIDPFDWECRDADTVFERVMSNLHDGAIILCHDAYDSTAAAIERLVPAILQKGYQFVTVSEILQGTEVLAGEVYNECI